MHSMRRTHFVDFVSTLTAASLCKALIFCAPTTIFLVGWFPDYYVGCFILAGILLIFSVAICQITDDGFS